MTHTLVLFDLDGTLINSAPDLCAAANRLRTRRSFPALAYESLRDFCGSGARGMVWQSLRVAPGSDAFEALKKEFLDDYGEHMDDNCHLFEGVQSMLSRLTQMGLDWGIVTNKSAVFARPLAEEKGLLPTAKCLVSGTDIGKLKPRPDPLLLGAAECGHSPCRTIYVGDDHRDALAAQAAGMAFIAAGWGYVNAGKSIHEWGAQAIAQRPEDLPALVASLSQAQI